MTTILSNQILALVLTMRLYGTWTAEVELDSETAPAGSVTLDLGGGVTLVGTVRYGGTSEGQSCVYVVGGAGGLSKSAVPKQWADAPIRTILTDLCGHAGERLAADLGSELDQHSSICVMGGTTAEAIQSLLRPLGMSWRMLRNGTIWAGKETWPDVDQANAWILSDDKSHRRLEITSESFFLSPGFIFRGYRLTDIEHRLSNRSLRTTAMYQSGDIRTDRLRQALSTIVRHETALIDRFGFYPCEVVLQSADGTLGLKPLDARISAMSNVPIKIGVPGVAVKIKPGGHVLLGWEGGLADKPYAALFEASSITEMRISADTKVVIDAPLVYLAGDGDDAKPIARVGDQVVSFITGLQIAAAAVPGAGAAMAVKAIGSIQGGSPKVRSLWDCV